MSGGAKALRIALIGAALGVASPAAAEDPGAAEALARARVCRAALDFACAEAELARARDGAASLDPATRQDVARLSAETALALGRGGEATVLLRDLLEGAPGFDPGEAWPPAWQQALEGVRASMPDRLGPEVAVEVPARAVDGQPVTVRVRATDRSGVGRVVLRVAGTPPLDLVLSTRDGRTWAGEVPSGRVATPEVAFWVEAWDVPGNGPVRWASAEEPHRVPVDVPPPVASRPVWKEWWFWTVLAAGAAGLGVGTYYLARPGGADTPAAAGSVDVEVRWPRP